VLLFSFVLSEKKIVSTIISKMFIKSTNQIEMEDKMKKTNKKFSHLLIVNTDISVTCADVKIGNEGGGGRER
jgi:hypothetical protein